MKKVTLKKMTRLVVWHTITMYCMAIAIFLVGGHNFANSLHVHINVMVLYSSIGKLANMTNIQQLAPIWELHMNNKSIYDSKWPFDISVETFEIATDCEVISTVMLARLNDRTQPNITAIVAEGDYCGVKGGLSSTIAANYGIPIILTTYNPDGITNNYRMLASQGTAFLINGPTFYKFRQLVLNYLQAGVQSVVVVANQGNSKYNLHSCFGAADLLASHGVRVMERFIIYSNQSTPRVREIVNLIKDLNPDAVLWCDRAGCRTAKSAALLLPLQRFKDANYLPKALSMLDCLDSHAIIDKSK